MSNLRAVSTLFAVAVAACSVGAAYGQSFPNRPIRILTAEPGGGSDFAARLIAQGMTGAGETVIIENRPGASGAVAAGAVKNAPPDGYTLLFYGNGFWLLPFLQSKLDYDPVKDFSPVTLAVTFPLVLTINPSVPAKTVQDLIALAKAKPGALNYGSGGDGTMQHLAGELFKSMAGVSVMRVPYKSTGPMINALLANDVQMEFANASSVASQVKAGKLISLAVASARPSALFPGVPTVASMGLPGYSAETMYGVFSPARTPDSVVDRLNQDIVHTLNSAAVKEKFVASGADVVASSPEELAVAVKNDMSRLGKVIKDAGIRTE